MWTLIKTLLTSPYTWIVIGIAALTIFISSLIISNNNLNHKNDFLKQDNVYKEQIIDMQKRSMAILEKDIKLQDQLIKEKQQVVVKQSSLNQRLNAIPKTSKDKPFSNNELFSAANELREYQQNAYPNNSPNNNN